MAAFMAVVLAVGLMPLPAFGDDGQVRGVSFNGNLIAGSISTTTTVDADGNVTSETTQTKVDDEGNVVSETTSTDDGGLDSDANLRGQYYLSQATTLKSDGTIQDLAGTGDIGKMPGGSDSRLSVAAGAAALEEREQEAADAERADAQARFDAEDAAIDVSGVEGDFSSQRIVVVLKDGADLQARDANNVTSSAGGLYVLSYKNVDAAKRAYVRYADYEGAEFVAPDVAVKATADGNDEGGGEPGDDPDAVADDGPDADDAEAPATDAPEADLGSLESDARALEDEAEQRASEEAGKPADDRTVVVALVDTAVAQDAAVARRLSVLGDAQPTVDDGDPDYDAKVAAQHGSHGQKMLDAITSTLKAQGAHAVDAEGNPLGAAAGDPASADGPKVQVISIEALDASGYGSAASVLAAAKLAVAAGADVVNMSFAGYDVEGNAAIGEAVKLASQGADERPNTDDDAAVIAAAGNQDMDARHFVPASSDGAYAVGTLDVLKVESLRAQVARELFPDASGSQSREATISLDDSQLVELDAEVAARIAADPQPYKQQSSNHGDAVDAWLIADSTSYAAALAAGYAAANAQTWRGTLATSRLAVGNTKEFTLNDSESTEGEETATKPGQGAEVGERSESGIVRFEGYYAEVEGTMDDLIAEGGSFTVPESGFSYGGHQFSGWRTDPIAEGASAILQPGTEVEGWSTRSDSGEDIDLAQYLQPEANGASMLVLYAIWVDDILPDIAGDIANAIAENGESVLGDIYDDIRSRGAEAGVWAAGSWRTIITYPAAGNVAWGKSSAQGSASSGAVVYDEATDSADIRYSGTAAAGGMSTITLPAGVYQLEAWGATGGGLYNVAPSGAVDSAVTVKGTSVSSAYIGAGGYSKGTVAFSEDTAVNVFVGRRGAYGQASGANSSGYTGIAYNGGGWSTEYGSYYYGGGGMTHFSLSNNLASASTTQSSSNGGQGSWTQAGTLLVAGGGGGTDNGDGRNGGGRSGGGFYTSSHPGRDASNTAHQTSYETMTNWLVESQTQGNRRGAGMTGAGHSNDQGSANDTPGGGGGWMGGFSGTGSGSGGGGTSHLGDQDYMYAWTGTGWARLGGTGVNGSAVLSKESAPDGSTVSYTYDTIPDGTSVKGVTDYGGKTYEVEGSSWRYGQTGYVGTPATTDSAIATRLNYTTNTGYNDAYHYDGYARITRLADYYVTYHDWSGNTLTRDAGYFDDEYRTRTAESLGLVNAGDAFAGWSTSQGGAVAEGLKMQSGQESAVISPTATIDLYPVAGAAPTQIGYTGNAQKYELEPGVYKLEAWGASGGGGMGGSGTYYLKRWPEDPTDNARASAGGYSYGYLDLSGRSANTNIYAYVGERGLADYSSSGGGTIRRASYNGGSQAEYSGAIHSGGGMTHFSLNPNGAAVGRTAASVGGSWTGKDGTLLVAGAGGSKDENNQPGISPGGGFVAGGNASLAATQLSGNAQGWSGNIALTGSNDYPSGGAGWWGGKGGSESGQPGGGSGHLGDQAELYKRVEGEGDDYAYDIANSASADYINKIADGTSVYGMTDYGSDTYWIHGSTMKYTASGYQSNPSKTISQYNSGYRYDGYARITKVGDYEITYHDWDGNVVGYGYAWAGEGYTTIPREMLTLNGGSVAASRTITGKDYDFMGWTTDEDNPLALRYFVGSDGKASISVTRSLDLYPAVSDYKVTYAAGYSGVGGEEDLEVVEDGGSLPDLVASTEATATLPGASEAEAGLRVVGGYVFDSWEVYYETDADGSTEVPEVTGNAVSRLPAGAAVRKSAGSPTGWAFTTGDPNSASATWTPVAWVAQGYAQDATTPNGSTKVTLGGDTTVKLRAIWKYDSLSTALRPACNPDLRFCAPASWCKYAGSRCKRRSAPSAR